MQTCLNIIRENPLPKDSWETPFNLFLQLEREFGPFDLDPCASPETAKCSQFFTPEDDGLSQDWFGKVFMNPPYGKNIIRWVRKAYQESQRGCMVVCLLPASTDTIWFHKYCLKGEIRFLRGRLCFGASKIRAQFPSMVVIFGRDNGSKETDKVEMTGTGRSRRKEGLIYAIRLANSYRYLWSLSVRMDRLAIRPGLVSGLCPVQKMRT